MSDGTVWAWGRGSEGELGDGSAVNRALPARVLKLSRVVKVVAGGETAYALDRHGRLWAWGSGLYGQLGNGLYGLLGNGYPYSLDEPTLVLNRGLAKRQPTTPSP
jgi:alpha-tubulin suppressor-like RCC1 family protein